jgi:hypothetical protein
MRATSSDDARENMRTGAASSIAPAAGPVLTRLVCQSFGHPDIVNLDEIVEGCFDARAPPGFLAPRKGGFHVELLDGITGYGAKSPPRKTFWV